MPSVDYRARAKKYVDRIVFVLISTVAMVVVMIGCFFLKGPGLVLTLVLVIALWLIFSVRHFRKIMKETGIAAEEKRLKDTYEQDLR